MKTVIDNKPATSTVINASIGICVVMAALVFSVIAAAS